MRGKVSKPLDVIGTPGITPAYAGKSKFHGSCLCITWDHPRLCGEKQSTAELGETIEGSPPPMRGKVVKLRYSRIHMGITPAYAGKSLYRLYKGFRYQDHPRLCGEKTNLDLGELGQRGSPPPMRGKGYKAIRSRCSRRITPAYAGKRKASVRRHSIP